MKKTVLISCLLVGCLVLTAGAQGSVERSTHLFAVKGGDSLRLDRYLLDEGPDRPRPCILFLFGGGFVSGERDAELYRPFFDFLARNGYAVVSADYRLGLRGAVGAQQEFDRQRFVSALERTIRMAVEDLYDATAYVVRHAKEWGVDARAIVSCGSSAGAITVLQGEYERCTQGPLAAAHLPEGFRYAGVISFAGALFGTGEPRWGATPAPIMLFHGDADANVPYASVGDEGAGFYGSQYIAAQLSAMRAPHYFVSVHNAAHEIAVQPMERNRFEIVDFLQKLVQNGERAIVDVRIEELDMPEKPKEFGMMDYIRANFAQ